MSPRPAACCGNCRHLVTINAQHACNVLGLKPASIKTTNIHSREWKEYHAAIWPWVNEHSVRVTDGCDLFQSEDGIPRELLRKIAKEMRR